MSVPGRVVFHEVCTIAQNGANRSFPTTQTGAATEGVRRATVYGPRAQLMYRINVAVGAAGTSQTDWAPLSELNGAPVVLAEYWYMDLQNVADTAWNGAVIYERDADLPAVG